MRQNIKFIIKEEYFMKHPSLDYEGLENILNTVPRDIPWFYILYTYIIVALKRNNGNRTKTSDEIKLPLRSLRFKFAAMETVGFTIPNNNKRGPYANEDY